MDYQVVSQSIRNQYPNGSSPLGDREIDFTGSHEDCEAYIKKWGYPILNTSHAWLVEIGHVFDTAYATERSDSCVLTIEEAYQEEED